ncbi:MAG: hypothetical protein CM15mP127_02820 [Gammaproteobacteria bacterium]|nr:MAG: hypothetical protein CM15mP127_02820 [Gammaproteobacteria bacterium]
MQNNSLISFLDHCFENFGSFQDAIDQKNQFLFHSLLSGYFNIGTLDPTKCIEQTENKVSTIKS